MKTVVDPYYTINLFPRDAREATYIPDAQWPAHLLEVVTRRTPMRHRRILETYATYFRREFNYDFVQYSCLERHQLDQTRPLLFIARGAYVGGCRFEWRRYTNAPAGWAMTWVWFHPYYRGQGLLSNAWPHLERWCPNFYVEHPLSPAMEGFLKARGRRSAPLLHPEMEEEVAV